ncbi:MAG: serine/threonine protein kinase, partial [Anaerolineales bacterium]|nr:serine/threonine protein kinase [Anaerolineales bacterium]
TITATTTATSTIPPTLATTTATSTIPPTLAAPTQPVTTPVLIPVTGIDFSGFDAELELLRQLLINIGIGLLGLALAFYGINYKFNRN